MLTADPTVQYVSFRLNHTLMGIDILDIREIVPMTRMTKVQKSPDYIAGLINLRGRILTVLDVGVLLGWNPSMIHGNTHVMVFKHRDAGFLVDETGDVVLPSAHDREPVPANLGSRMQQYVKTVVAMPGEVMVVLDAGRILSLPKKQQV